jgi:hypothetical protein
MFLFKGYAKMVSSPGRKTVAFKAETKEGRGKLIAGE